MSTAYETWEQSGRSDLSLDASHAAVGPSQAIHLAPELTSLKPFPQQGIPVPEYKPGTVPNSLVLLQLQCKQKRWTALLE